MPARQVAFSFLVAFVLVPCARAQEKQSNKPGVLKKALETVIVDAKAGKADKVAAYFQESVLPNYEAWFQETFGPEGQRLAADYAKATQEFSTVLTSTIVNMAAAGKMEAEVVVPGAPGSWMDAVPLLQVRPTALYQARLLSKDQNLMLGFFVHSDGRFRLVGRLKVLEQAGNLGPQLIRPSIAFDEPEPIDRIRIRYPEAAKQARIQGTVRIAVLIGENGNVRSLRVIRGHPLLA